MFIELKNIHEHVSILLVGGRSRRFELYGLVSDTVLWRHVGLGIEGRGGGREERERERQRQRERERGRERCVGREGKREIEIDRWANSTFSILLF